MLLWRTQPYAVTPWHRPDKPMRLSPTTLPRTATSPPVMSFGLGFGATRSTRGRRQSRNSPRVERVDRHPARCPPVRPNPPRRLEIACQFEGYAGVLVDSSGRSRRTPQARARSAPSGPSNEQSVLASAGAGLVPAVTSARASRRENRRIGDRLGDRGDGHARSGATSRA